MIRLLLLALLLAGCNADPDLSAAAPGAPPAVVVVAPETSLSLPAALTVVAKDVPDPPGTDVFSEYEVNVAGAETVGPVEVSWPNAPERSLVVASYEASGIFIPLDTRLEGGQAKATLDVASQPLGLPDPDGDGRDIMLSLVRIRDLAPPAAWNSYNAYVFEGSQPVERKFLSLGQPVGAQPDPGVRPAVMLHGLGAVIAGDSRWRTIARTLRDQLGATSVFGFEYDSQDAVLNNGNYLREFLQRMSTGQQWIFVAHSMGTLVSRSALEGGTLPIAPTGNKAYFLCGPHQGTRAAVILQGSLSLGQRLVRYLLMNNVMQFKNADGSRADVNVQNPGFTNLRPDSSFLAALNANAAQNHPQVGYGTLAGNSRGLSYVVLDYILGETFDDGLVNLGSANSPVLGQLRSDTAAVDHSSVLEDAGALGKAVLFLQ